MSELGVEPHIVEACLNHVSGAAKAGVAGRYNHAKYNPQKRAALNLWASDIAVILARPAATTSSGCITERADLRGLVDGGKLGTLGPSRAIYTKQPPR